MTEEQRGEVEEHLRDCTACEFELKDLQRVVGLLRSVPSVPVPRSFAIGPRAAKPAALSGTFGGFLRAATSVAAAVVFVTAGTTLAIFGRSHQTSVVAPAQTSQLSRAAASESQVAAGRPQAAAPAAAAGSGQSVEADARPSAQSVAGAAGSAAPVSSRLGGEAASAQAAQPAQAPMSANWAVRAVLIALLALSAGAGAYSIRWWRW